MNILRQYAFLIILSFVMGCAASQTDKPTAPTLDPSAKLRSEPEFMTASVRPPTSRELVAVAGFENKSTYSADKLWDTSSQLLASHLIQMGYFRVVEWEKMKQLFDWRELSTLSIVNSPMVRQKAQKILLCDHFITGAVTFFDVSQRSRVSAMSKSKEIETAIRVDLRLQNAMTGEYLGAGTGQWTERQQFDQGKLGSWDPRAADKALNYSIRQALLKLTENIARHHQKAETQAVLKDSQDVSPQVKCPPKYAGKRIAVIFQETYTTVQGKPLQGNSQEFLTAIMNEALLKLGLQPLDPKYVSRAIHARQKQLILAGDIVAAAKAGNKLGASLMLYGQIFSNAHSIETVQTGFKNFYVQAVFKIMSPSTSKILAAHTFGQTVTGSDQRSETIDLIKNNAAGIVADLCRQLK